MLEKNMKNILLPLILILAVPLASANNGIARFTTDGCSAFPNGRLFGTQNEWKHCCIIHDIDYWMGGSKIQKSDSDKELNKCVTLVAGSLLGTVMEAGVNLGGIPSHLPWRWGYGWEKNRNYKQLTKKENQSIVLELDLLIDTLAIELKELNKEQQDLILIKVKNEIDDLTPYIQGSDIARYQEYERLILRVEDLRQHL